MEDRSMSRPSNNVDLLLIKAGRGIFREQGIADLKIRQVAKKAGVNLGMFHYHFKTKQEFVRRVLKETYDEFFSRFQIETRHEGPAIERLKKALIALAKFVRDHRLIAMAIIQDILRGNAATTDFAKKNLTAHISVLIGLIRECQKDGTLKKMPLPRVAAFVVGSVMTPLLITSVAEKVRPQRPFGHSMPEMKELLLSDEAIEERVQIALTAVAAEKKQ
jgi:AcrR family transcriptional regulator